MTEERDDEPPPFMGRWRWIYLLVAGLLAVERRRTSADRERAIEG